MTLHATAAIEDAYEATRSLLLPFRARRWVVLAVMALFVGGFGSVGGNVSMGDGGPTDGGFPGVDFPADAFPYVGALVVALAVLALLVGLAVLLVGSVMEFVLVEALATREARIRGRFGDHVGDGLRLFGFRLALAVVFLVVLGAAVALGFALQGPGIRVLAVVFAIPVVLLLGGFLAVVNGFTTVFVVPVMLAEDRGVLDAWGRFWETLSGEWAEYGAYLLLSVALSLVGAALVGTVVGVVAAVVLLPLGALGLLGLFAALAGGVPLLALVVILPLVVVALALLLAVAAVVRVPVVVYLRYYALFVLGATDPDLDLVADLRESGGGDDEPAASAA